MKKKLSSKEILLLSTNLYSKQFIKKKSIIFTTISLFLIFILSTIFCTKIESKNLKKFDLSEIKEQTVVLENIMIVTHANSLSKQEVKEFIDKNMPSLLNQFNVILKEKYNADLDSSEYESQLKAGKQTFKTSEIGKVVMASWKIKKDVLYKASLNITLKYKTGKASVSSIISKKDENDLKNPYTNMVVFSYSIK